ncbi:hypothetical protein [Cyclobacterium qasimii]|uniref:Uncharacterized protein n=2 Tax=Cyclobacterium qasimii TaxID=1350429 RepID=S7X6C8_9BACT|nr:hypothetical protein [Cyclobacterium qasimii]EPR71603.1 hypothetical protein ADICYQ_0271 [Cyclobacterium qasimii M12-11B]GEO20305.1 hypothetical protein CQA01_08390 [Cyclobacterium qasimii]
MQEGVISISNLESFDELFESYKSATVLTRGEKAQKILGQLDAWCNTIEGIQQIYERIPAMDQAGILKDTPWENPSRLVPQLVNGTYKSGHPNSTYELLSELRMLALARGKIEASESMKEEAESYLQEALVLNLEFVFNEPQEETRLLMSEHELKKVHSLFGFVSEQIQLSKVKAALVEELELICEQRPVVTEKQRRIIALVKEKIELDPNDPADTALLAFQRSIYRPTSGTVDKTFAEYGEYLNGLKETQLETEAEQISESMLSYGLVSTYHATLLLFLVKEKKYDLVAKCLALDEAGVVRFNEHQEFVCSIIADVIHPYNAQCIYGLSKTLENGVLSRTAVRAGLHNLLTISLHPKVEERIIKSVGSSTSAVSPKQYLIGALLRILGQPLGVGQGNNPTCQSARGISMWSQHAPAKLIHMVHSAAVHDDLSFRFEGSEIKYSESALGLVQKLDHQLDAVSVTLVPMLDKIYNEMMRRASGRGEDPHKWVNPGLYGQWIQIGFASAYDYLSNAIVDFDGFLRVFYGMCHPEYNGGHRLVYPNPVGIFITTAKGEMLGFHAISLLRVEKDPKGEERAYFLNPNNEGRQNWGQGITPSVYGNGEIHGESSLPIHQFAARIYAFHYNNLDAASKMDKIPQSEVDTVKELAKESWGKSYIWLEFKKQW